MYICTLRAASCVLSVASLRRLFSASAERFSFNWSCFNLHPMRWVQNWHICGKSGVWIAAFATQLASFFPPGQSLLEILSVIDRLWFHVVVQVDPNPRSRRPPTVPDPRRRKLHWRSRRPSRIWIEIKIQKLLAVEPWRSKDAKRHHRLDSHAICWVRRWWWKASFVSVVACWTDKYPGAEGVWSRLDIICSLVVGSSRMISTPGRQHVWFADGMST